MPRIRVLIAISLLLLIVTSTILVSQTKAFPGDQPAIVVEPSNIQDTSMTIGSTFSVNITIYNVTTYNVPAGLGGAEFHLSWNTSILTPVSFVSYVGQTGGVFSGSDPFLYAIAAGFYDISDKRILSSPYTSAVSYAVAVFSQGSPWFGDGLMATLTFKVLANGTSPLAFTYVALADVNTVILSCYSQDGFFSNVPIVLQQQLSASISPTSATIPLGQNVNLTSTVSGGVPPYGYQWYANNTSILGANSNSWDFTPTAIGFYNVHVNVTDNVGNTTSANASVTATSPAPLVASITSSSTTVYVGQIVNLNSAVGGGISPYSYQWLLNGNLIPNATLANYAFSPTSSGLYLLSMNATDSYGTTSQSNIVSITVMPPLTGPEIYIDPSQILNLSLGPGSMFSINITVANVTNLGVCTYNLTYDPQVLTWIGFNFVETQGEYPLAVFTGNTITGYAWISLYYTAPITVQKAPLTVLNFYVNSYGITPLNLTDTLLLDQYDNPIVHNTFNGIFANIIRDVAVTNVVPSATWVYQNWTDVINVTVANFGNVTESFNVSAWYNSSLIGTASVWLLAPSATTTVSIIWDTAGVVAGNYTITGTASFVPYETYFNTINNVYIDGTVQVFTTIQDVAITFVQPTIQWVYAGQTVPINVIAANLGGMTESFNVTAYYNGTVIDTLLITNIAKNTSQVLTFYWNTTGISVEGNYILSAFASYVPYEYNTINNYLTGGQELVLAQIRDVAITDVEPYETYFNATYPQIISPIYNVPMVEMYANRILTVNVTATNLGNVTETFSVSAVIDGNTTLGTLLISNLAPQSSYVLTFQWSPTGMTPSSTALHTVSANASLVPYEYNTANNFMASSVKVMIKQVGDINGDGKINLSDLGILAKLYNSHIGLANYNPEADFNNDGKVNLVDLGTLAKNYSTSY